jgi:UDP-glucose 4-epimerase
MILVTGSNGFLGQAVSRLLLRQGVPVFGIDIHEESVCLEADLYCQWNITRPADHSILDTLKKLEIEVVLHTAAIADFESCSANPVLAQKVNVEGTKNVFELSVSLRAAKFIYCSSLYALGSHGGVYGETKRLAEALLDDERDRGIEVLNLYFGSLFGPGAQAWNGLERLIRQAINIGAIDYRGDGSELRSYIHIEDAARSTVDLIVKDLQELPTHRVLVTGNETYTSPLLTNQFFQTLITEDDHYQILQTKIAAVSLNTYSIQIQKPFFSA